MYLNLLLLLVFFACLAMLFNAGLWSNAISLVNVMTAGLLATSFFEPVANWLQSQMPTYTYFCDFLALWGTFAICVIVLRTITDKLSKVKVRFKRPVDLAGSLFFASWIGWVMICFTLMSLHTAPLARSFMRGEFQARPMDRMFLGLAPDRKWLGFVKKMSVGTLSRSAPKGNPQAYVFDPQSEFILKYGERRAQFEKELTSRVNAK